MNYLFIHNNNIPAVSESSSIIEFTTIDSTLGEIKEIDFDTVFIKDNLSSNYLELYGLHLACHIRLSQELGEKRFIPIVILSDIDSHILNKLDPIARILFTKNIFIIKNTREAIEEFHKKQNLKPLTSDEHKNNFLDLIEVKPPENSTSHSIANEWAIERWASLLEVDTDAIKNNRAKISSMLYFKYLSQKYEINSSSRVKDIKQNNIAGKLLFIDDKGSDGWNNIVEKYTKSHYSNLEFESLDSDFSDIDSIKDKVKSSIEDNIPNIVLLDLRLLQSDINKETVNNISGVQILNYIKDLNPSIQVIMFTASNDSLILDALFKVGILGYVKKDAPTDKDKTVNNGFEKLDELIRESIDKKYLIDVYQIQKDIISSQIIKNNQMNINIRKKKTEDSQFKKVFKLTEEEKQINELEQVIKTVFIVLNSNMPDNYIFAIQSIYKCIETICTYYIEEKETTNDNDESYRHKKYEAHWRYDNRNIGNTSTSNKLSKIKERFTIVYENHLFSDLKKIRNNSIHPNQILHNTDINTDNLFKWFNLVKTIVLKLETDS